jgi:hypothetical protein
VGHGGWRGVVGKLLVQTESQVNTTVDMGTSRIIEFELLVLVF